MTPDDTSTREQHTTTTGSDTTTASTRAQGGRDRAAVGETMSEVDQTHPDTNRAFGFAVYGRGVVADGGRRQEEKSIEDIDHESETDGASRRSDTERGNE
ncbi:MAG: hypothetical protein J07HX64_02143 [halophilic archaeon J07HX64]|jgi:hypothetical protein|nr:MAG: hypothetical protein J07HX64_02143 [halophilic archaeon J07HX64]